MIIRRPFKNRKRIKPAKKEFDKDVSLHHGSRILDLVPKRRPDSPEYRAFLTRTPSMSKKLVHEVEVKNPDATVKEKANKAYELVDNYINTGTYKEKTIHGEGYIADLDLIDSGMDILQGEIFKYGESESLLKEELEKKDKEEEELLKIIKTRRERKEKKHEIIQ